MENQVWICSTSPCLATLTSANLPFSRQGSVARAPLKDLNWNTAVAPHQRYCFLWFQSPTVNHALKTLSRKFQKPIMSRAKLYDVRKVIKSLTLFVISRIPIITLPSVFTEHTLPTCLLVLPQLQMKSHRWPLQGWCYSWFQISMVVFRAHSQELCVPRSANHKPG